MPAKLSLADTRFVCIQCRKSLTSSRRRRFASTKASSAPEIFDIVTVGGGPAGLALQAALSSLFPPCLVVTEGTTANLLTESSPITSHLKTALIETQDLPKLRQWSLPEDKYSNRASSLTPSSVSFLETTGAWGHVDQSRVQAYDEMQVWDAANDATLQFDWTAETSKYNAPPSTVATMTENANLTRGLLERIAQLGAESSLFSNTSVSSITNGEDDPNGLNLSTWPVLALEPKTPSPSSPSSQHLSTIAARLLVGADGFNSPVRTFAGIASHGWDYNRHGVVATLTVQPADDSLNADDFDLFSEEPLGNRATAYQRFLPELGGPIAILPLPNNHASLVWSTTPANAAYLKSLPPAAQLAMINAALRLSQTDIKYMFSLPCAEDAAAQHEDELRWRLQHTQPPPTARAPPIITGVQEKTLASFPLRLRHATSLTGPRVALIGDAAHTVHPLAGQGLNLGLGDAAALADAVAYAVEHGMDIGDAFALERYNAARFGKGLVMAGGVDALNWLYQMGSAGDGSMLSRLVGTARGLGMKVVGSGVVPGLKSLIMKQAT
ncbi:ubiquinone biosynthesis monooxygenase COQ6 [Fonsecaea monophora]|uniref:Ubiquinone biosynthesis monooxygenase COQ6, mitochondrial n=1 Tax=Fonsecaea monophora TaxID=254056 RepID=A0A177FMQ9_9EURO|nr:ubiquinone biosynthesis monooxygenase COQ6 [Fonsecaea monophora]KAH0842214.1 Ubiquinone biosynthesis monooxygenase COQ6 [Fonsecaea pedrosoi]OAG45528.1 ubiquinone biosynthesis monooxygenase COQ6 [Fonsecaea monophora]